MISFIAAATAYDNGDNKVVITRPGSVANGHFLVVAIASNSATATTPTGWTLQLVTNNGGYRQYIFTKFAGASEPATYTFNLSALVGATGLLAAYSGVDPAAPVDAASAASGSGSTITAPSLTTLGNDRRVIVITGAALVGSSDSGTIGTPAGTTSRAARSGAGLSDPNVRLSDFTQTLRGATPVETASSSTGDTNIGQQIALAPLNSAPNAPTLTNPVGGASIDRTVTQRFTWTVSDPDTADPQSRYDMQWRLVGAGSWTSATGITPNTFRDFAAGSLGAGDYEWQVRTYDSHGAIGPWSSSAFFTAADTPAAPTITAPAGGATITTPIDNVTWSYPDQASYQVRVLADDSGVPDTSTVYSDTGEVIDAASRSLPLSFTVNGQYEHVQVRVRDSSTSLWTAWSSVRVFVNHDQPSAPEVLNVLADDTIAAISLTIDNPAPGAGEVVAVSNDIYRRAAADDASGGIRIAKNLPPGAFFVDYTPASGLDYAYQVVAVAESGSVRPSVWVTGHGPYPTSALFPDASVFPGS